MNKSKIIICIIILITLILIGASIYMLTGNDLNSVIKSDEVYSYDFTDTKIPGSEYEVKINSKTKVLDITTSHFCSAIDCETKVDNCTIKLTKDEYDKVMSIWDDQETLSPILDHICKNDKIFYSSFEYSYLSDINDYRKMDTDSDGKISNREFANDWLNKVIKNK